jgi:carboxyl-terminal processing protease|tara:strand:+ start:611 stop:1765 length:1155 start_codon:yes stop_codon:yes gene_type:complete
MKKNNYFKYILVSIIFVSLNTFGHVYSQNVDKLYEKIDLFSEVLEKVQNEYVEDVDQAEAMDAAINGLLQSLDPYSGYMNPDIYEESQSETSGEFGGLGIEVTMESGVVKVITPIDDTPASKAGVKAGDYIVKINGKQVRGKTLMEAVNLMRGPVGSSIKITVRRKNLKKPKIFKIVREIIEVRSVVSKTISDKVGYLRLRAFNQNSSNQLKTEISKIEKNKKLVGYILDLRNNPGGLLNQAIAVTDFFLDDGEIVSTKGRKNRDSRKFFANEGDEIEGKPLIVLINNGSASASEIVAGALQDQKRAVLLGETTFGKGSVQSIIPLKNRGALRLTIAKYYLPSGKSISEIGVIPDIKVEEVGEEFSINTETDNQLNYAVKLFIG